LIYQETLEAAFRELSGCTAAEAEEFRRNVAKKKVDKVKKVYPKFMEGATAKVGVEQAQQVFDQMVTFGQYGFNRSVDGTTILNSKDGEKELKCFKQGDIVLGVDDFGSLIENKVVALHDHGSLEGFEVTFESGHAVIVSANHKFLTADGMVPLHSIVATGKEVLCVGSMEWEDGIRKLEIAMRSGIQEPQSDKAPCEAMSTLYRADEEGRPKNRIQGAMWGNDVNATAWKDSSERLYKLREHQTSQHHQKEYVTQSKFEAASDCLGYCAKNFLPQGYSASARGEASCVAGFSPRRASSECIKGNALTQEEQARSGYAKAPWVAYGSDSLRRGKKAGRFSVGAHLDRGGRSVAFLPDAQGSSQAEIDYCSVSGRNVECGSAKARSMLDTHRSGLLFEMEGGSAEARMEGLAYSDAPLSSTGCLVSRKIVRVRSVGPRRMYDLEVAHPKHNYCLPGGIVTSNSHSICYSIIAYACAFLKHHYPIEWWCAVLRNADKKEITEKFWKYCNHYIDLPDIRYSGNEFEVQNNRIRAPLSFLQGVGPAAHEELNLYRPITSIEDLCRKINQRKRDLMVPAIDKATGQPKVDDQGHLKMRLGRSALNSGIVGKMIVTGVADSLFPPGLAIIQKYQLFEQSLVDSFNELNGTKKKVKGGKKIEARNEMLCNLTALSRYQMQKQILPIYSENLVPHLLDQKYHGLIYSKRDPSRVLYAPSDESVHKDILWQKGGRLYDTALPVVSGEEIKFLNTQPIEGKKSLNVAAVGYVLAERRFRFQNGSKEALSLTFDVEGETFEFVKWGDRKTGELKVPAGSLVGTILLFMLNRYRDDRGFSIDAVQVVQPVVKEEKDEESNDE
jgi:hypothetical protein